MKNLITIILLLICSQNGICQSGFINGYIFDRNDSSTVVGAYLVMHEVNKTLTTSNKGYFEICGLKPGEYSLGITLIGYKDTTISSLKVEADSSVHIEIYLSTCYFHVFGKTNICPKCGRDDMVVPILYEMATKKMIKRARKGIVYLGGHRTGCDPTYYCKRDSLKY
jgi:hypothetical protein